MTETSFRFLGALHLVYAFMVLGGLANALKEGSGIDLSRTQWGIKSLLWLIESALLAICGVAALVLEPSAHVFSWLALIAFLLVACSNSVALEGPRALLDFPPEFYGQVLIRISAAVMLYVLA